MRIAIMRAFMKNVCVLVSGGLDSCVLVAELAKEAQVVWPIYIRQGLRWEVTELFWLKKYLKALRLRSLQPLKIFHEPMAELYGKHWSTGGKVVPGPRTPDEAVFLPGRNMVLSLKAAVFAAMNGVPAIALGSLNHNPFPDASFEFFKRWGKVLSIGLGKRVSILAPYRGLSKIDVIRRAARFPLHLSFSCLAPRGTKHCGRCNKCAERRSAFLKAGVADKTAYAQR